MKGKIEVVVENRLVVEKRDVSVFHKGGKSGHIISVNNAVTLPLGIGNFDDYLHLSLLSGSGRQEKDCVIDLPAWADFELFSEGRLISRKNGGRVHLTLPPGPATWQLKVMCDDSETLPPVACRLTLGNI